MNNLQQSGDFDYKQTRDGILFVYWKDKLVRTFRGETASRLIAKLDNSKSHEERQLILAKATGNFKRGNER